MQLFLKFKKERSLFTVQVTLIVYFFAWEFRNTKIQNKNGSYSSHFSFNLSLTKPTPLFKKKQFSKLFNFSPL